MNTQVKAIGKTFGSSEALKDINVEINTGEFVAILGPSGCGKTTLLRLIAGFEKPTSGEIIMGDDIVATPKMVLPPESRNLGMVFQSFALWPHMTVLQQVLFPLEHHRFIPVEHKRKRLERAHDMLSIVGLSSFSKRLPSELSGGQKQRVAIARALAPQPGLLLMDEPLSSLDAELRVELRREIQSIHRQSKAAIVYVTHDQGEALAMADKIIVMQNGQIEQVGTAEEIYLHPETSFVATFVSKANLVPGIWNGSTFHPFGHDAIHWEGHTIHASFREEGIFPVRPELFSLQQEVNKEALIGRLVNVQFQGKDVHYTIECKGEIWTIVENLPIRHSLEDEVFITYLG